MSNIHSQKLLVEYRSTASVTSDPKNPRKHSARQVRQIARSIEAFGFNVPVLIDQNNKIVAGHGRVSAARSLMLAEIPTIRLDRMSEAQARAFMIADNRLTENSVWDDGLLAESLGILSQADLDFDIETTGFSMGEIDLRIDDSGHSPNDDAPDPADTLPPDCRTRVSTKGDLWVLRDHRVLCGDALTAQSYSLLMEKCGFRRSRPCIPI